MFSFPTNDELLQTDAHNFIASALEVHGNIASQSDLYIVGTVQGDVTCQQTVFVAATATITGNIVAQNIVNHGSIQGNAIAQSFVALGKTASVGGEVRSRKLILQTGAKLSNGCELLG